MARKKKSGIIRFAAIYEDGKKAKFSIDTFTLRSGDRIAIVVAGERQRAGQLPSGRIVRVEREY